MKDYRPYAKICMKWGLIGCVYIIGPVIYFYYRRKKGIPKEKDFFRFYGAMHGPYYLIYGLMLYGLELIKFGLYYLYKFVRRVIR